MEDNNVASTPQLSVSRSQGAAEEVLDEHDYLTYLNQVRRYCADSVDIV